MTAGSTAAGSHWAWSQKLFDDFMWQGIKAAIILVLLGLFLRLIRNG